MKDYDGDVKAMHDSIEEVSKALEYADTPWAFVGDREPAPARAHEWNVAYEAARKALDDMIRMTEKAMIIEVPEPKRRNTVSKMAFDKETNTRYSVVYDENGRAVSRSPDRVVPERHYGERR